MRLTSTASAAHIHRRADGHAGKRIPDVDRPGPALRPVVRHHGARTITALVEAVRAGLSGSTFALR